MKPELALRLVMNQTDPRLTDAKPQAAVVRYIKRETLSLPIGSVVAHHLRVELSENKGRATDLWFGADAAEMRHALVKYEGPYGVKYELKKFGWWAYWNQDEPPPE